MIAIDLSKQQVLNADPKTIHQTKRQCILLLKRQKKTF